MFARSPTDIIPRTRQAIGTKTIMITISFTGCKPVVLDILPKQSKFNRLYSVDSFFPDLKKENVNFIIGSRSRLSGCISTTQCATMDQNWHQNSRSIMFRDCRTHSIRRPQAPATFGSLELEC
jgi:hypothetical protein